MNYIKLLDPNFIPQVIVDLHKNEAEFLDSTGKIHKTPFSLSKPHTSFFGWLKDFFRGREIVQLKLSQESLPVYIKIDALKTVLNPETIQELKKGKVDPFLKEQERLRTQKLGLELIAIRKLEFQKGLQRKNLLDFYATKGFAGLEEFKASLEQKVKPQKTKPQEQKKLLRINEKQEIMWQKAQEDRVEYKAESRVLTIAKTLHLTSDEIKGLLRWGRKVSFQTLSQKLEEARDQNEQRLMLKSFAQKGKKLAKRET